MVLENRIPLDGVPGNIRADYEKALQALNHPDLYEFAILLARRSLESILSTRYKGGNLSDLVQQLLDDKGNGLSHGLLENIDAIRHLGNMGAHISPHPADKSQCEWSVTIWERLLQEWYIRPAQDEAQRIVLEAKGITLKVPTNTD